MHDALPQGLPPGLWRLPWPRLRRALTVAALHLHQFLWLGVFLVPFQRGLLPAALVLGMLLVIGVEMGHHRYFSHRSFRVGRGFQCVIALWASASFERGILWWASMHRLHHRHSDTPLDPHTPLRRAGGGFLHAWLRWAVHPRNAEPDYRLVKDLLAYPELRFIGQFPYLVSAAYAGLAWGLGAAGWVGSSGLQTWVWLYALPVTLCQQIISTQATLAHGVPRLPGSYQPLPCQDASLNHRWLGLISTGGGFHNNHHHFPSSARLGLRPGEWDISYGAILLFKRLGLVHSITVPQRALDYGRTGRVGPDRS